MDQLRVNDTYRGWVWGESIYDKITRVSHIARNELSPDYFRRFQINLAVVPVLSIIFLSQIRVCVIELSAVITLHIPFVHKTLSSYKFSSSLGLGSTYSAQSFCLSQFKKSDRCCFVIWRLHNFITNSLRTKFPYLICGYILEIAL